MGLRRTRGIVLNIVIFWTILVVILYINRQPSFDKTFQWTRISYQTVSDTLPESHGICPGLTDSKKPVLVVGRMSYEDATWLEGLEGKYHLCVYTADHDQDSASEIGEDDNPSGKSSSWSWTNRLSSSSSSSTKNQKMLQTPANRGHESMAYLSFIIDNYDSIPSAGAVFVHGNQYQWHNDAPDYNNLPLLSELNISSALAVTGYHNLRCDWSAGTCSYKEARPQNSVETLTRAMLEHGNVRAVSDAKLPGALVDLFAPADTRSTAPSEVLLGGADAVRAQCCAQFVVSRASIHRHTRDEYIAIRQWLLDGSNTTTTGTTTTTSSSPGIVNTKAAPSDDLIAGRVLSYIWHILFIPTGTTAEGGEEGGVHLGRLNQLACPNAAECYCRLYNRCDLKACTKERCPHQYRVPPGFKVPEHFLNKNTEEAH